MRKWPASEAIYPFPFALGGLLATLGLATIGLRHGAIRPIGIAYAAALAFLFAVHFVFGWRSFQALGDLTVMQTRYYNILWPGIALAATAAAASIGQRRRSAEWVAAAFIVSPTVVGALAFAAV